MNTKCSSKSLAARFYQCAGRTGGCADDKRSVRIVRILLLPVLAVAMAGATCDPTGLAGGLTGESNPLLGGSGKPSITVSPPEHFMRDKDYVILFAKTANLPAASTDADGIHQDPKIRWTLVSGSGGLNLVDPAAEVSIHSPTLMTDPATEFGRAVLYFPDVGTNGDVVVRADAVRPTDRTVINEFGEPVQEHEDIVLASSEVVIHVNNELRLRLTPPVTTLPGAGTVTLKAIAEPEGAPTGLAVDDLRYEWGFSGLAGAGTLSASPDSDTAVFTAGTEAATFTVRVKAFEKVDGGGEREIGTAGAVVEVDPELKTVITFGYYIVEFGADSCDGYNANSYVYFPKIAGALSYTVYGEGMHDPYYWGTERVWSWSAADIRPRSGNLCAGLDEIGGAYRFRLTAASGTDIAGYIAASDARFAGMRVIVKAVVRG